MKVVGVTPLPVSFSYGAECLSRYLRRQRINFLLVRAEAEDGSVGYGEVCDSFCCTYPAAVGGLITDIYAPLLVNKVVADVDEVVTELVRVTRRRVGDHGVAVEALSGVEIALWDLKGKSTGKSVSELLGATRTELPIYASGSFLDEGGADWHMEFFKPLFERGVRAIKVRLSANYEPQLRTLRDLRAQLGDGIRIMVDGSECFTLEEAMAIARKLADLGIFWFEEPIPQCEREAIATLVQRSPLPIAYGEHLFQVHDFADCLRNRRANYVQPDASICGGMAEGIRIGKMAGRYGVPVAPHAAAGPVSLAANIHMAAAIGDIELLEYSFPLAPAWNELSNSNLQIEEIRDGKIRVPSGFGLGVSSLAAIESHGFQPRVVGA